MMSRHQKRLVKIEAVHSNHDGGWYAEVSEVETGRTVYESDVYLSPNYAIRESRVWASNNGYERA